MSYWGAFFRIFTCWDMQSSIVSTFGFYQFHLGPESTMGNVLVMWIDSGEQSLLFREHSYDVNQEWEHQLCYGTHLNQIMC